MAATAIQQQSPIAEPTPASATQPQPQPQPISHEHVLTSDFEPKRVICLPVDESDASKNTVSWVIQKFHLDKEGDQVVLLNTRPFTVPDLAIGYPYAPYTFNGEMVTQLEEANKMKSHKLLQTLAKEFQAAGIHVRAVALVGEARQALEEKIKKLNPTCVVMGNRGLGPVSRVFLGSISQHLIHHSSAPVMIVPYHPDPKKQV